MLLEHYASANLESELNIIRDNVKYISDSMKKLKSQGTGEGTFSVPSRYYLSVQNYLLDMEFDIKILDTSNNYTKFQVFYYFDPPITFKALLSLNKIISKL